MLRYLPRDAAPLTDATWQALEQTVTGAARSQLAGRRLLEIMGPLGLGVRTIGKVERAAEGEAIFHQARATMSSASTLSLPLLQSSFTLAIRDLAAAEEAGNPLDLAEPALAAIATARLEDQLVFWGNPELRIDGLMRVPGALGDWTQLGRPMEDLIAAASALDTAGFPGPYAAALSPALHNQLFRVYEDSNLTQLEHARQLITGGIVKAPALAEGAAGGVLLAVGSQFAHLIVGQDMTPAFVGPQGANYEFVILESLAPRISVPQAICVLGASAPRAKRR